MHSASTGASQPSANASQPSATSAVPPDGSGAPQSAALTSAQKALVDDIKSFGRMPDRKKATSAEDRAENNLAQRYEKLEKGFPLPEHIKQELHVLGDAPQPAAWSPCVAPGTTDVQAPFEPQGRGLFHGHDKGHDILGPTLK